MPRRVKWSTPHTRRAALRFSDQTEPIGRVKIGDPPKLGTLCFLPLKRGGVPNFEKCSLAKPLGTEVGTGSSLQG